MVGKNRRNWTSLIPREQLHCVVLLTVSMLFSFPSHLLGKTQSLQPRSSRLVWRLDSSDCDLPRNRIKHNRESSPDPNQPAWEQFEFSAGYGTEVLVSHEVETARLIREWQAQVSVKASQPGIQVYARVVLPNSNHPDTGEQLTVLLAGTQTTTGNNWQTLTVGGANSDVRKLFEQQLWVLRRKHLGLTIDERDAYIDRLIVNIYTLPGTHRVSLTEPIVKGVVGANELANAVAMTTQPFMDLAVKQVSLQSDDDDRSTASLRRDGTVLELRGEPFFPRIVQYNGETFEYLKSLGFNTIQLATTATDVQLNEAEQSDVWLLSPPPPSLNANSMAMRSNRVVAWSLGESLTEQELLSVENRTRELRQADQLAGRPVFVGAQSNWAAFSQVVDAMIVGQLPYGTGFPLNQYSDWIAGCAASTGNSIPLWVDVQTEFSANTIRQIGGLVGQVPPLPIEPQQIQCAMFEALAGGARGIRFLSRSRLDASDPQSRLKAATLQWLNKKLNQFEPWAVAGTVMGQLPTGNRSLQVTALKTNRATLLLVQQTTGWEQWVSGDAPLQTVRFTDQFSAVSDRAYLMADYGLVPLSNSHSPGGMEIQIDACPQMAAVVLTQDPLVINHLSGLYDRPGSDTLVNLRDQLTHQWMAIMQLIENQASRYGGGAPPATNALNEAVRLVRQAESFIAAGSQITATTYLDAADQQLAVSRRELLAAAQGGFRGNVSAPLLTHVSLLPLHWQMAQQASQAEWQANALAGAEFENLEQLVTNKWENVRTTDPDVETLVELSPQAAVAGKFGLKITSATSQINSGLTQIAPLKIISGPVAIPASKMIRIHGWVKMDKPLSGTNEGLLLFDSLGGREMGQRIRSTNGWEEVVFYRAATEATELRLNFVLTGMGQVMLDEFTIRSIDLPSLPPRTATSESSGRAR